MISFPESSGWKGFKRAIESGKFITPDRCHPSKADHDSKMDGLAMKSLPINRKLWFEGRLG
jgi:hypothetical protein